MLPGSCAYTDKLLRAFPRPSKKIMILFLKLDYKHFLPYNFQFIIHKEITNRCDIIVRT